jgi:hypothetical protein
MANDDVTAGDEEATDAVDEQSTDDPGAAEDVTDVAPDDTATAGPDDGGMVAQQGGLDDGDATGDADSRSVDADEQAATNQGGDAAPRRDCRTRSHLHG